MKKIFLLILLSFNIFATEAILEIENEVDAYLSSKSFLVEQTDIERLQKLEDFSNKLNDYAPSFHRGVIKRLESRAPLHGQMLTYLHKTVSVFIKLGYQLEKLEASALSEVGVLAGLTKVDNFYKSYYSFYTHSKFRNYVNDADLSFEIRVRELKRQIGHIISKKFISSLKRRTIELGGDHSELAWRIFHHDVKPFLLDSSAQESFRKSLAKQKFKDFFENALEFLTHHVSGVFGNGVGAVRWRKGYLLPRKNIHQEIFETIRPLDVITEKTYFALTDTFIPGHFGHNAIWLGTKAQLLEIGMWDHPAIVPYHRDIERGKSILETDRSGTHLKSLEDFMNVDEFAILRLKDINEQDYSRIYKVALSQMGKTYDFNFDVETTDKIVCSELLYQSFGKTNWPTESRLGRVTITPDNVVSLALYDESPLQLIYYVAEKKKGRLRYKNTDDLALDIGFKKVDGRYKRPQKVCTITKRRASGQMRRGSRNRFTKSCQTKFSFVRYQAHDDLGGFPDISVPYVLSK